MPWRICFSVASSALVGAPDRKDKGEVELPLELCYIKMQGFSCKLVNGVSLLPSFMHRLEARLLAAQLRCMLSQSYPAASQLSIDRVWICFAQSLVNLIPCSGLDVFQPEWGAY